MENNLTIVPVLNKIDLPTARPEPIIEEMETAVGTKAEDVLKCSAKSGLGIMEVLDAIVDRVPAPSGKQDNPLKALIYNSHFDPYKGVVVYCRLFEGTIKTGQKIKLMRGNTTYVVMEVGQFRPKMQPCDTLIAGQVGYFMAQSN